MNLIIFFVPFFTLIVLANLVEARNNPNLTRVVKGMMLLFNLPFFLLGLVLLLASGASLTEFMAQSGLAIQNFQPIGVAFLLMAVWGMVVILPEPRRFLARWLPLNPASTVHTLALIFSGYLLGNSAVNLSQGGLEGLAENTTAASVLSVVGTELLFVAAAVAGVGLFIRRDGLKVLDRLGLHRPSWRELARSLRWVVLLVFLQWLVGIVALLLNPEQAKLLESVNNFLLQDFDTVWEWFALAMAAAVGEEILFRGALQPVLGLWATAFLFAFAHVQYGFSPITAFVFVIGAVLGIIRRRHSTTVTIFVHFSYNFILGLLALLTPYLQSLTGG